ncbi:Holliday junction resolvase-like protein [Psychrobacter sp. G]|uniref:Holliday junction resolvase-like protein n=1 Tax=Psychrobacter sp. G TaxID=571800 RepID=UPI0003F872EB|nr:Holliday junction resolvase-like protein [Psychrobacter sp. G]
MFEKEAAFQQQLAKDIKEAQKRSNNMQRNVLKGQIGEQSTPFITDFLYNPSDCRFMGEPIDYVIFQNLHECADGNVPIEDVHLIITEVKTGNARLNQRQKIIKQAKIGRLASKSLE